VGQIELNISILTGAVVGLFLIVAELVAMHKKVSKYRAHLRTLYQSGRKFRLFAEVGGWAAFFLVQPVIAGLLTVEALGNFNPQFSEHAGSQLRQKLSGEDGAQQETRPLRGER
jgi:hypothetical protein